MNQSYVFEASAPGRLDVMGGIADYSGSWVLQMPIKQQTRIKLQLRNDFICRITSKVGQEPEWSLNMSYLDLLQNKKVDYAYANNHFKSIKANWAAYIVGCALVLQKEKGIDFTGADFTLHSDVPLGKGVSSSASVEVATMRALADSFRLSLSPTELPLLAQKVENYIAGAPCGLMDQLTSHLGKPDHLLPIKCQPDQVEPPLLIPKGIYFSGIDSGVKHTIAGHGYTQVRCAAFMGYSIIAKDLGATQADLNHSRLTGERDHLPLQGYLCNLSSAEFKKHVSRLPQKLVGKHFLENYSTIDPVTQVHPDTEYDILTCSAHPVYENERVQKFRTILTNSTLTPDQLTTLGQLMYQSHESYSRCGLGSPKTDELVAFAKETTGIFGAKITGGGQGGTVCFLTQDAGRDAILKLHEQFARKQGQSLALFKSW